MRGPDPFRDRGFKSLLFPHWNPPGSLFLCHNSASLKPWGELGALTAVPERGAWCFSHVLVSALTLCAPARDMVQVLQPKAKQVLENTCLRYISPPNTMLLRNLISLRNRVCFLKWMCVYMPVCTFNTILCVNSVHLLYIIKKKKLQTNKRNVGVQWKPDTDSEPNFPE